MFSQLSLLMVIFGLNLAPSHSLSESRSRRSPIIRIQKVSNNVDLFSKLFNFFVCYRQSSPRIVSVVMRRSGTTAMRTRRGTDPSASQSSKEGGQGYSISWRGFQSGNSLMRIADPALHKVTFKTGRTFFCKALPITHLSTGKFYGKNYCFFISLTFYKCKIRSGFSKNWWSSDQRSASIFCRYTERGEGVVLKETMIIFWKFLTLLRLQPCLAVCRSVSGGHDHGQDKGVGPGYGGLAAAAAGAPAQVDPGGSRHPRP